MGQRATALAIGSLLVALLAGCVRAVYEETPTPTEPGPTVVPTTDIFGYNPEPTAAPTPSGPPSVYLEPSVVSLSVGETATVNIWIEAAQRLNRFSITLSFDPDYVQIDDADSALAGIQIAPGTIPEPVQILQNEVQIGDRGEIHYEVAQAPETGASGNGLVATLTLRALAAGGTPLRFEAVAAYDPEGNPLEVIALSDGLITVAEGEGGPTPTAAAGQPTPPPAAPTAGPTQPPAQPTAQPAPVAGVGIYYVVQPGENLFRIGLKFGTTAQAIAQATGLSDPNQVKAGAMVLVPVAPPRGRVGYYVQRHDTVFSIAQRFGLTVEQLVAQNQIGPDYAIEVGQILVIAP